ALAPARAARRLRSAVGLPERDGLLVRAVEADSPAGRAGIQRGDLLVSVEGRALASIDDLFDALEAAAGDGRGLAVGVVRGTEEREVSVAL
ncbi:MAG TPA: PDZ domain-containing protein, partial [Solirubrobacteraceae bacterium]|nr:PDZ domain-containing protein [Solirubrobacteraceae bacterium]